MSQMKLGWWKDREGKEHKVDTRYNAVGFPWWSSLSITSWDDDGQWCKLRSTERDLIEFICPLEEIPPALNSAVKAAEDRVRELKQLVDETQTAWATACRLHEAAQKDLERLEKECEQPVTNAAQVGDHGQGFMPAIKEDKAHQ